MSHVGNHGEATGCVLWWSKCGLRKPSRLLLWIACGLEIGMFEKVRVNENVCWILCVHVCSITVLSNPLWSAPALLICQNRKSGVYGGIRGFYFQNMWKKGHRNKHRWGQGSWRLWVSTLQNSVALAVPAALQQRHQLVPGSRIGNWFAACTSKLYKFSRSISTPSISNAL